MKSVKIDVLFHMLVVGCCEWLFAYRAGKRDSVTNTHSRHVEMHVDVRSEQSRSEYKGRSQEILNRLFNNPI